MIKLHLGCGTKHIDGYVNIDARYLPGVDEVDNIKFLRKYKPNSVDVIYTSHTLEHVGRYEVEGVLRRWYEILKPGGILRLAVPNFEAICKYYMQNHHHKKIQLNDVMGLLYGGQDYDGNFHYVTFDNKSLHSTLSKLGFREYQTYDRDKTEHSHIDDFSNSYIPHMDKNGLLMSLNIEAVK